MNWIELLLLFSSAILLSSATRDDPTLVTLPEGQIRGHILNSRNNNVYYAFQEIPYADPPIGQLRLQAPVAPEKWNGIRDATRNTKICHQSGYPFHFPNATQTEDCLYLNVFTPLKPSKNTEKLLPVLVWIHEGAFEFGSGVPETTNPELFMDYEIIVVTINYRLGALGFLTTEDGVIPGNIGLKDQQLALKWVKKNINLFGGDSDKITISGDSAGGVSVGLHLISKKNKGLFRGAILQSGSPLCQWSHQDYARFYAFELGRSLDTNFTSDNSKDLLKLLQSVPATDINNNTITTDIGKETGIVEGLGLIWLPVIEDENLEGALLTGPFHDDIKAGNINQVPTVISFNSQEELLFMKDVPSIVPIRAKYLDSDLSNLIRNRFNMTKENKVNAGVKLRKIYADGLFENDLGAVVKFFSDASFTTSIIRHAKLQSKYSDVFLYQFSYKGKMGGLKDAEVAGVRGVGHNEQLGYLWDSPITSDGSPDEPEDLVTRHRLLNLWSNFVKYLNPTPRKDSLLFNITWETVSENNLVYLDINSKLEMKKNPKQYLKWENIIDKYAVPPFISY